MSDCEHKNAIIVAHLPELCNRPPRVVRWCPCGAISRDDDWQLPRNAARLERLEELLKRGRIVRAKYRSGVGYEECEFARAIDALADEPEEGEPDPPPPRGFERCSRCNITETMVTFRGEPTCVGCLMKLDPVECTTQWAHAAEPEAPKPDPLAAANAVVKAAVEWFEDESPETRIAMRHRVCDYVGKVGDNEADETPCVYECTAARAALVQVGTLRQETCRRCAKLAANADTARDRIDRVNKRIKELSTSGKIGDRRRESLETWLRERVEDIQTSISRLLAEDEVARQRIAALEDVAHKPDPLAEASLAVIAEVGRWRVSKADITSHPLANAYDALIKLQETQA